MDIVLSLPERLATLRDMAYANRCSVNECMACYLCNENDSFSIWAYNSRCTPTKVRKVVAEFDRLYPRAWILPKNVISCDQIEVIGINLVLYNAQEL